MKNLYKALAEFQRECPTILKETEGYGYSYADLPAIFEVIMPLLKKHDLGFTQLLQADGLETIVFHVESGEEIRSVTSIPQGVQLAKMNTYQAMGSAYTYYKRYALSAMLGLVTDKDTDAQDAPATPARSAQPKFTSPAAVASIHVCRDCGAPEIRNPKTNKIFCSQKCWLKKPQQAPVPSIQVDSYSQDEVYPPPPFEG